MNINDLNDGDRALCRCGRAGRDKVEWEPWKPRELYIQRDRKDRVCVLALKDRPDFAEFDPRYGVEEMTPDTMLLMTEDYYLEIKREHKRAENSDRKSTR